MAKIYITDTVFYNRGSSIMLGWDPTWFGLPENEWGDPLENAVKKLQQELDIKVDGLVGPTTFIRLQTHRESELVIANYLHLGMASPAIDYHKVDVTKYYNKLPSSNYKFVPLESIRKINKIVIHWDAALSIDSCFNILKKRGVSTHFGVDNDGTVFQLLNTNHVAYHVKESNNDSIGIDISNAFYLKYNDTYKKRGFGLRPVITSKVNGKSVGPHLGYYPQQIEAAKELIKVLCRHYKIPLNIPSKFVDTPATTSGVMFHYHLNDSKIDTAGFPLEQILKNLIEEQE